MLLLYSDPWTRRRSRDRATLRWSRDTKLPEQQSSHRKAGISKKTLETIDSQQYSTGRDHIQPKDDEVKMREYGKYDEQDAEYANLGNYEDFPNDGETAELMRNITSKSGECTDPLEDVHHFEVPHRSTLRNYREDRRLQEARREDLSSTRTPSPTGISLKASRLQNSRVKSSNRRSTSANKKEGLERQLRPHRRGDHPSAPATWGQGRANVPGGGAVE